MATGAAREMCESCGATFHAESPAGLCPACLLTTAIEEGDIEERVSGSRIQDYELLNEVARGGMGIVYRARQHVPPRIVALKMILPTHVGSAEAMKRFRAETEAAASLEHEGILPIFAVGEYDGAPFYSMKFAEGGTLSARINNYRDKPREAAALIAKLARAVAFAHERGILHRDLKPANVLFDSAGKLYVSDFGLAKWLARESDLTQTLAVLGTPFYMAPEQAIASQTVTVSPDVYSLGAILYHLLTGHPPFTGDTPMEVLRRAENQPAPRPRLTNRGIPPDLETICLKCLEKDPAWRYSSAAAFADDLDRFCTGRTIQARRAGLLTRAGKWVQRKPAIAALIISLLALAAALGWNIWKSELIRRPLTTGIAVLPFENLSDEKEHAFFADGVHDDILTKLAKIADLKVISRTSVMQYRGKQNVREIGNALRVSHVLEGTVRRSAGKVHINAQLVDARTDTHIWAQTYDGDLTDVFGIQSRIARGIAEQLQAKISSEEKAAIAQAPTTDVLANDLYQRGLQLEHQPPEDQSLRQAVRLLEQAVERDPEFALAYCALSRKHMSLYFGGYDHTPERRDLARVALENAARIQPDAGEVHLAAAQYWFHGFFDYDRARAELELARRNLPNDPKVYLMTAAMDRRQGRWSEAVGNFERAAELDPRDLDSVMNAAFTYEGLKRYSDATRMYGRAAALSPPDYGPRIAARGNQALNERADIRPLRAELNAIMAEDPKAAQQISADLYFCAILERDRAAVDTALANIPAEGLFVADNFVRPREWFVGYVARMFGDTETARTAFTIARSKLEKIVQEQPDYAGAWSLLGRIDAALGRKEEAIREGRRACELLPLSKDAWFGPGHLRYLAEIYAWTGEKDLAITQLEQLAASKVSPVDYGDLKLDPDWDPLRGDPRFEKIVASLAPKKMVTSE